ncbi:MAG: oligosaccharide flippase family protein [Bacteroidetes bacterium]|nr:oligosaccharide flippase family protein [Bacteroidota bacterium]
MKLLRSLSIYTFVGFFGAGVNFLLMPIISHYLTPEDYGITALINTYVSLLLPLVSVVAYSLISVSYFQLEDPKEFASLFSSVSFIPLLPTLFLFLIAWPSYGSIAAALELPADAPWWGLSMFPLAMMSIYIETTLGYLIYAKQANTYALYNIGKALTEVGLTLVFVVGLRMGWKGRILAWIIASFVFTLVGFVYFFRKGLLTTDIRWKYIREGLLFGAPLILHTLGKFAVNQSDRLFISKMVSVSEAGIYSVGYTIGTVMLIVGTAIANVVSPYIMERLKAPDEAQQRQIRRLTYASMGGLVLVLLLLNLVSPFFFRFFMDPRYAEGAHYVFWVSVGYLFWAIYMLFTAYIYYYKKNNYLVILAGVNIVSNLVFNYIFIRHFGGIGAAYATALSFFINLVLLLFKVKRMMPWLRFALHDFKSLRGG